MIAKPEKYIFSFQQAERYFQTADHLTYITFPLIKENRLLLKILEELNLSLLNIINAVLQYEYLYKRIHIYSNAKDNLQTFKSISGRYNISQEQLQKLMEILFLAEKHKKSPFEFVKNNKIVIMSENNQANTLTLDKIKEYLLELKDLLRKASLIIRKIA